MDEFNYLQYPIDDDQLLLAENYLVQESFPTFSIVCDNGFGDISFPSAEEAPRDPKSRKTETNEVNTTTTPETTDEVDVTRFPVVSSDEIQELKSVTVNKNMSRSTKQWMNIFQTWAKTRHLENVSIKTMPPEELDTVLRKFYAEIKKKDGGDYKPESLKIMQSAIERHLKDKNYPLSIVRSREFHNSQEVLNAKALSLRQQGKGKRPNKAQALTPDKEFALWEKGQLGNFNGKVLTNVNCKNLTEQLGLRGHQEHYNAHVEDLVIRQQEDGSEVVEFREGPTKTWSGGLSIRRRTTPQIMHSTDSGKNNLVRLFKLWLSKRPEGMKDTGPLYLSVINHTKSTDVLYTKIWMGQNTTGNIMKSMASCLKTNKKLTNHSMRKTLVSKLMNSGQPCNVICEITGHAHESSLDDYDEINENQRKELSHIISGYKEVQNQKRPNEVSNQTSANESSNQALAVQCQRPPLALIHHVQQEGQIHQAMMGFNPGFLPAGCSGFPPSFPSQFQYRMAAFTSSGSPIPSPSYTVCTFNFYSKDVSEKSEPRKKRRAYIIESDDEDWTFKWTVLFC